MFSNTEVDTAVIYYLQLVASSYPSALLTIAMHTDIISSQHTGLNETMPSYYSRVGGVIDPRHFTAFKFSINYFWYHPLIEIYWKISFKNKVATYK